MSQHCLHCIISEQWAVVHRIATSIFATTVAALGPGIGWDDQSFTSAFPQLLVSYTWTALYNAACKPAKNTNIDFGHVPCYIFATSLSRHADVLTTHWHHASFLNLTFDSINSQTPDCTIEQQTNVTMATGGASTHHFNASKLFDASGYVCVITGGGTGIGLMAAQSLAANGARVYILGRRMEALEKAAKSHHDPSGGGQIIPLGPCDVTKKEDLQRVVKELEGKEKYVNMLMCNAGVGGPKAPPEQEDAKDLKKNLWENESVEAWNDCYNVDVTAVYFTTVAFMPLLQAAIKPKGPLENFSPSVITTSSMSGLMRNSQGHFAYNTAKGATVQLTKLMSAEFMKAGVRVNSIAPGYFPSEMTTKASGDDQKSELPHEQIQEKGHVPSARAGKEEEMGMAVLFLTKNEYVNGQILAVEGGVLNVVSS
ncbi:hypothetical protein LTR74_000529 [Friedmanniomyces endolithicus]|nr:hypothetical protein LTR74_000529 [Friedmanniomyces endolithicus]